MDESVRELIHRTIDSQATVEEAQRLEAVIAADPEARAEWEDLLTLCRMFEEAGSSDPPAEWKEELLQRLRARAPRAARAEAPATARISGWLSRAGAAFRPRLVPSIGFAFAAGAIAGIALFAALGPFERARLDDSSLGTMLRSNRGGPGRLVGEARLDVVGARGRAVARVVGGFARVEIDMESEQPAEIEIEFDPHVLHLRGFQQQAPVNGQVVAGADRVRIEHRGGDHYELWFEPGAQRATAGVERSVEIRIRLQSGGQALERALRVFAAGS